MAKVKEKGTDQDETVKEQVITPENQLKALLTNTKEDHYNFEETHDYRVPCSSIYLSSMLGGGLGPGAHRFVGLASGGKTSASLDFMYHFLVDTKTKRRGIYIKSEGRLSEEMKNRSGVTFVYDWDQWKDGTCFVYESNIYEAVFKLKRELIANNPTKTEYFFITDSADSLIKRDDAKKAEEDSITVGGGSLITSVFLKKTGLAMAKRGHIDIYISQIRDQIKINQYEVTVPKQGKASGARALEHQADIVLEFLPRYGGDLIFEGEKGSKVIGHFAKVKIIKSNNEKNMVELKYPIRYGQVGGKSVWTSYELADLMIIWELVVKKGAWFFLDTVFLQDILNATNIEMPDKFQGLERLRKFVEENKKVQDYLFERFRHLTF
jgi:hypothetical protein